MVTGPKDAVKAAHVSDCGRYRYQLTRDWSFAQGRLAFIMLNPSTADATEDDPTIRRCMGFAEALGYGGISVVNLYAWRATDPEDLWAAEKAGEDVHGPENLAYLYLTLDGPGYERDQPVIAAWGAGAKPDALANLLVLPNLHRLHHLGLTKDGAPRHPLYLPGTARPEPWTSPAA